MTEDRRRRVGGPARSRPPRHNPSLCTVFEGPPGGPASRARPDQPAGQPSQKNYVPDKKALSQDPSIRARLARVEAAADIYLEEVSALLAALGVVLLLKT